MTYLEMCQAVVREGRISNDVAPTTVIGQVGTLASVVHWVASEWVDIQEKRVDWDFLRKEDVATVAMVAGQNFYTPTEFGVAADFNSWAKETFRVFDTSSGNVSEIVMQHRSFDYMRDAYIYGGTRSTRAEPFEFGIRPSDHAIVVGPTPSAGWTVTGDYFRTPVDLAADGDIPAIPSQYHMMIVWGALWNYGYSESAPEVIERAKRKYVQKMAALGAEWKPRFVWGAALA